MFSDGGRGQRGPDRPNPTPSWVLLWLKQHTVLAASSGPSDVAGGQAGGGGCSEALVILGVGHRGGEGVQHQERGVDGGGVGHRRGGREVEHRLLVGHHGGQ